MSLYNAHPKDGVAWVTGASSGIGYAIALKLCAEGYTVVATARSGEKLEQLANDVTSANLSGKVIPRPGDVTDSTQMANIVTDIADNLGGLALAILNAGVYIPVNADNLQISDFEKTFAVNLTGVVNGLVPVVDAMKNQAKGQIALVSSVTGYGGLPTSAAYGATKAAVINMAESLKFDLDDMNIRIQIINPGFVRTAATDQNEFEMPSIVSAEEAAGRIAQGLKRNHFEITFPKRFTYVLKFINLMPYRIYFALVGRTKKAK
tara:strand:+ start:1384 stop:2172 length:789 start_codon:yes stop_codon:yes gene_type:complete